MNNLLRSTFGSAVTIGVLAAGVMFTGTAKADGLAFNSELVNHTYYGTSNPQGGWTVSTGNGVEVALRAQYRYGDAVYTPTDDYSVQAGGCITDPCNTKGSNATLALWNYAFSIDLSGTALTLSDVAAYTTLTITKMDGSATPPSFTFHPVSDITDNYFLNTNHGAQNSENLGWTPISFSPTAGYEYDFTLNVGDASNSSLASVDIEVQPTPEPSAIILFGTALFGAFTLARRRRNA